MSLWITKMAPGSHCYGTWYLGTAAPPQHGWQVSVHLQSSQACQLPGQLLTSMKMPAMAVREQPRTAPPAQLLGDQCLRETRDVPPDG